MNLHIMFMAKGSLLMQRALQLAATMPLNHPDFKSTIIDKLCKPNGYYQVSRGAVACHGCTAQCRDVPHNCL
jgi:hypothetical protein